MPIQEALRKFRPAAAAVVLALLVPPVTFSESTLKSLMSGWLERCLIVIEKEQLSPIKLMVTGYMRGQAPSALPLSFSANKPLLLNVKFLSSADLTGANKDANLGLHPMAGETCPGALCEGTVYTDGGEPKINFTLRDLSESFLYRFHIRLAKPGTLDDLGVFVVYETGLKGGVCRVENATLFNWPVRASPLGKILASALLLLVAGSAVLVLTGWSKKGD